MKGVLVCSALAFAVACGGAGRVPGREARYVVAHGGVLLDVRTQGEYVVRHIDGARNIPLDELESRASELGDRSTPVVVYCLSGHRSAEGAAILRRAGFTEVYDVGSMFDY